MPTKELPIEEVLKHARAISILRVLIEENHLEASPLDTGDEASVLSDLRRLLELPHDYESRNAYPEAWEWVKSYPQTLLYLIAEANLTVKEFFAPLHNSPYIGKLLSVPEVLRQLYATEDDKLAFIRQVFLQGTTTVGTRVLQIATELGISKTALTEMFIEKLRQLTQQGHWRAARAFFFANCFGNSEQAEPFTKAQQWLADRRPGLNYWSLLANEETLIQVMQTIHPNCLFGEPDAPSAEVKQILLSCADCCVDVPLAPNQHTLARLLHIRLGHEKTVDLFNGAVRRLRDLDGVDQRLLDRVPASLLALVAQAASLSTKWIIYFAARLPSLREKLLKQIKTITPVDYAYWRATWKIMNFTAAERRFVTALDQKLKNSLLEEGWLFGKMRATRVNDTQRFGVRQKLYSFDEQGEPQQREVWHLTEYQTSYPHDSRCRVKYGDEVVYVPPITGHEQEAYNPETGRMEVPKQAVLFYFVDRNN